MRLYLDDDSIFPVLVKLLRQARHDVLVPGDLGIAGAEDPVHLRHAIREDRVFLSHNYDDFKFLHELLLEGKGHHPGILIIRRDNNPTRDMKPPHIVRAISNLTAAGLLVPDRYVVLNQWR
jgi:predicted nuclease of predicted toxin-antitoxin system